MTVQKIGVISGGSGSSKFVSALDKYLPLHSIRASYVANVGDNFWHYGLYICPDIDILTYTLAGCLDQDKGWGIKNDSLNFVRSYSRLYPQDAWFSLGDSDLALCLRRTELLKSGWHIDKITDHFRKIFQIESPIIPASNSKVETYIGTKNSGLIHLQDFWVKNKGRPIVTKIEYPGLSSAEPNPSLKNALSSKVLILPANPVSSILPTINLPHVRSILKKASSVIAISPFVGNRPFSGPARKFMKAIGSEASSYGVASLYSDFLRVFLVHRTEDAKMVKRINEMGIECIRTNTLIRNPNDNLKLVNEIVKML